MSHSWLKRLVPIVLLVPGVILTGTVVMPATAHATVMTTCDPLELRVAVRGSQESFDFKMTNCTSALQYVVLSAERRPTVKCPHSGLNTGDSPIVRLAAHQTRNFYFNDSKPTCKDTYTVSADSEIDGTETVLDADVTTYKV